ncbi:hypothetical protein EVG20_g6306 [Dentipellis fragilis]|uniref:BTB domain-containing protein n=1 Tax=Dentipellis fragilis TaxID=205917 RepID=A0A4Y9YM12_9AGAM|nr:hypothetical protein EVG20_g6306 [Dentipellis fragilis]
MSYLAVAADSAEQDLHGPDVADLPVDGVPDNTACRARARKLLETKMVSLAADLFLSDFAWAATFLPSLVASYPSATHDAAPFRQLLYHHNSLAPINSLPVELLTEIFSHLAHDSEISPALANGHLVRASGVCAYWREAALSCPNLWTRIDLFKSDLAALAFERCQNLSVYASLTLPRAGKFVHSKTLAACAFIREHAAQVAGIAFELPTGAHIEFLHSLPPLLPVLRRLVLDDISCDRISIMALSPDVVSLSPETAPSLRRLGLFYSSLPWTFPIFRGLQSLQVRCQAPHAIPSLSTFRDVLLACPELENLLLYDAGPLPSDSETDASLIDPVPLLKLRRLKLKYYGDLRDVHDPQSYDLTGGSARTTLILSHLMIPRSTFITTTIFEPTVLLHRSLLARYDSLILGERLTLCSSTGHGGALEIVDVEEHHPNLNEILHHPSVNMIILKRRHVVKLGDKLSALMAKLDFQRVQTFRTLTLSPERVLTILIKEKIRGLKRLEIQNICGQASVAQSTLPDGERSQSLIYTVPGSQVGRLDMAPSWSTTMMQALSISKATGEKEMSQRILSISSSSLSSILVDEQTPLDGLEADIILRSSDSVDFRTHKCILVIVSPVFRTFFQATQMQDRSITGSAQSGNSNWEGGLPVLRLPGDGQTLQFLLSTILPIPIVYPTSFRNALSAIDAAEDYKIAGASNKLRELIQGHEPYSTINPDKALRAYGQACLYRLEKRALTAAALILHSNRRLVDYGRGLEYVGSMALSALVEYRRNVVAAVVTLLEEIRSAKPLGPDLHYSVMWKCEEHAPPWWPVYWTTIIDSVKSDSSTPTSDSIVNQLALYELLRSLGKSRGDDPKLARIKSPPTCSSCMGVKPEDVAYFCRAMENEIRARIKKVMLDFDKAFDKRVLDDDEN